MKQFIKNAVYLSAFVLAGVVFQISCSNSDDSGTSNNLTPSAQNKLLFFKDNSVEGRGLWLCDYDGSNQTKIPITLPAGFSFSTYDNVSMTLSPDGEKVFFAAIQNSTPTQASIFSCNTDGTDLHEIVNPDEDSLITVADAN